MTSMPRTVRMIEPSMSLSITQLSKQKTEQGGVHAGCLVDQVATGLSGQRHGVALLETGLGIGHFGIGHARGHAAGQIVELRHLGTGPH